jgi:hypothetical protein
MINRTSEDTKFGKDNKEGFEVMQKMKDLALWGGHRALRRWRNRTVKSHECDSTSSSLLCIFNPVHFIRFIQVPRCLDFGFWIIMSYTRNTHAFF